MTNGIVRRTQLDRDKTTLANPQSAQQVMEIGEKYSKLYQTLKGMVGYEEEYYKSFELMVEAYHVVGTELRDMEKATGGWPADNLAVPEGDRKITLSELGITKKQSSEWQTISLLPKREIDDYILTRKREHDVVTKADIIRLASAYKSAQQVYDELVKGTIDTMRAFIIQAKKVVDHRLEYSDVEMKTKEDLFETSELCAKILDELNRSTM